MSSVNFKSTRATQAATPITHSGGPVVTGTSVLGIKYKDGVMLAADCLASYGSLARFRDVDRLQPVGEHTVVGASGDIGDFQYVQDLLEKSMIHEFYTADGHALATPHIYSYLSRLMYQRRSQMNPLWNSYLVGGLNDSGEPFLGYIDLIGTTYQSSTIATGFGAYLAQPILRKAVEGRENEITEEEAIKIIDDCMRVLFYRDARSLNKFRRAKVTKEGVTVTEPYSLTTEWGFAENIIGYGA
ncbi:Proteasome subunit beta type-7 [Dimargaris cristalligena]|uniref:Proteasome subunit beta n=1 Tax=Dimargaris cristalligena TaxID=215637 RepID=A0A4P9ZUZ0_9FUNG|nr:Proteasome subunit beta type-7 [Dimargaris cristalligena]RKP37377.1 putative PRE4-20S proteasome subunit [Dimargaris cristalligena]|eukprot:RKP37377.1 putative PRE4-20S proteasome subunit [Dimargaris cristalligena]